jgi:hypothetical protein
MTKIDIVEVIRERERRELKVDCAGSWFAGLSLINWQHKKKALDAGIIRFQHPVPGGTVSRRYF